MLTGVNLSSIASAMRPLLMTAQHLYSGGRYFETTARKPATAK